MKIISRILRKEKFISASFPSKTKLLTEIVCGEEKKSEKGIVSGWTPIVQHVNRVEMREVRSRILGGVVSGLSERQMLLQTSPSKGFSYYFHDSSTDLYFRSTTRQCRCYPKQKQLRTV